MGGMAVRGAARAAGRRILSVWVSTTLALTAAGLMPRPAMAQGGTNFDWSGYCNSLIDKQIAAGRATEAQRSGAQSECMAVQAVCMFKFGAFASVDPDTQKKINECFVEGMKPAGSEGGKRRVRRHRVSDDGDGGLGGCSIEGDSDADRVAESCTQAIATATTAHQRALAYAYRGLAETAQDNQDHSGRALADAEKARDLDGNLAVAYYVIGTLNANAVHPAPAIENLNRAIPLLPRSHLLEAAYSVRGASHELLRVARHSQEEARLAIADFTRALELEKDPDMYRHRANEEEYLGQASAARADREAARQLDGKSE